MAQFDYTKQKEMIAGYLKKYEKSEDNLLIGAEFEHFIVSGKQDDYLRSIDYYEKGGIKELLQCLQKLQECTPIHEKENLIGLIGDKITYTLEPAAQLEVSAGPFKNIMEMDEKYQEFLEQITPLLNSNNQFIKYAGYQLKSKIDELPIIPKEKYGLMYDYFKQRGSHAHNMMKGSCSVQVAVDYCNEADYVNKFRLANKLAPILGAVFDNSPVFEGKVYEEECLRNRIWDNCDDDRCGIIACVFDEDFSYEKYAEYILNLPPICFTDEGELLFTGATKFKDILDPERHGDAEVEQALVMSFNDVRSKQYIELRTADALPYPLNLAVPAFIKGIFNHKESLQKAQETMAGYTFQDLQDLKKELGSNGIFSSFNNGMRVIDIFEELVQIAGEGLEKKEMIYLEPLTGIIDGKYQKSTLKKSNNQSLTKEYKKCSCCTTI